MLHRISFKILFFLLWVYTFSSCQKLEKEDIPLGAGIRIAEPVEITKVQNDLKKIQSLGFKEISLEILVQTIGDSAWPHIHETTIHTLLAIQNLPEWKTFQINLIFGHADTPYLYPKGAPTQAEQWFLRYQKTVDYVLSLCNFKPKRIIAGVDLIYEKEFLPYWKNWTALLRAQYHIPISYTCHFTTLHESYLMNDSDEIGLFYEISSNEEPKKHARDWHKNISRYAQQAQKPIIITHANIYGNTGALIEFKNRLRFWSVPVQLISLNSIFPESIFSHQGNYFDATQDVEFQMYIKEYLSSQ